MAWWYPRTTNRIATYVAITGITTLSKISFVSIRVPLGKSGKLPGSISTLPVDNQRLVLHSLGTFPTYPVQENYVLKTLICLFPFFEGAAET